MQGLDKLATLAQALPENVRQNAIDLVERMGEVIEGIGDRPKEWRPEILKLVQGTTDRSKLPKGANIGSMVHIEEVLDQPYPVHVIRSWTIRQMWHPDKEEAKILCSSPNGLTGSRYGTCKDCQFGKFDEVANKSACNKGITVAIISADLSKIFNVNFAKTNYSNGTDWTKLMTKAGVATWKKTYSLSSKTSAKNKNVEVLVASPLGNTDKELYPFLQELFDLMKSDREKFLEKFKEYVSNAPSNPLLAAPDDNTTVLLEAPASDEPAAEPTHGGKGYSL